MKTLSCFSILFIMVIYSLQAQSLGSLSGKVIGNYQEKNLQNVALSVLNTSLKTVSKQDGTFVLEQLPLGSFVLKISLKGFETVLLPIQTEGGNKNIDLGLIRLTEKAEEERDLSFIHLHTDDILSNDKGVSNSIAGLLVASKDVFFKTVAYEFSPTFFRPRNLGAEHGSVLLNGTDMNKMYNAKPQWSNWGGLNDVLRNQEFTPNLSPSTAVFGGVSGVTNIFTRASNYRKGLKISYASSNRSYKGRVMASYSSGLSQHGWAYTLSASRRFANEGFREGTAYTANSFFMAVEKAIGQKHHLNLTAIYASNTRGKSSPNTQEVYDLKDIKYNAYWGFQDGVIRNSRTRKIVEPILQIGHYWDMNAGTSLQTNITYQFGKTGNSRLDYGGTRLVEDADGNLGAIGGGANPDPTYYQKLPSYFLRDSNNPDYAKAYLAEQEFLENGQISWKDLYAANQNSGHNDHAIYALYEDRNDDKQMTFNTILYKKIGQNFICNSSLSYRRLKSENFANMLDLLGANSFLDVDVYADNIMEAQSDLQNPNKLVSKNEPFKYHFKLDASIINAFAQTRYFTKKLDAFLALNYQNTNYQRTGIFENGAYPGEASLGKSQALHFSNFGLKSGLGYKFTGRHIIALNAAYKTRAPTLQNSFSNARENNDVVIGLRDEKIITADLSYHIRHPKITAKFTGYGILLKDQTDISFYFADGLNLVNTTETTAFVQEVLRGIDQQSFGMEMGAEIPVIGNIKLKGVAAIGQSVYTSNPNLYLTSDDFKEPLHYGEVFLKNYFVAGGPQQAYSLGFEYSSPNYWWFGSSANYFDRAYIHVAPINRTKNFYLDADGLPINDYDPETAKKLLGQEKFDAYYLINMVGGKSWKVKDYYFGFFMHVSNILNRAYKTGGFEQSRNANYHTLLEDQSREKPLFGPKYWFGYGTSYYTSVYFRF